MTDPTPPSAALMTREQAHHLVEEAVAAIYDNDHPRFVSALTESYEPNGPNLRLILTVIPLTAGAYMRGAMPSDARILGVPSTPDDAPEDAWWATRIMAAAVSDDRDQVQALVEALANRVETSDDAVGVGVGVLTALTATLVTSVRVYIAAKGRDASPEVQS